MPHLCGAAKHVSQPIPDETPKLSAALEGALLHELREQYRLLALAHFKGSLELPQIELVPSRARLGRWVEATRTIELSRSFVLSEPWGTVVEVLKHEMAHQYVSEVLGKRDETAHGPSFRAVCDRLGIDGSATGIPTTTAPAPERAEQRRLGDRIARLLALADSPNVHEAEAAMAAAQRLLLKHNIELRDARAAQGYVWRHLGTPTGRTTEAERVLSLLLSKHFFVEAIWIPVYRVTEGKRGSVLEICGTAENVEIAEYVHGYLTTTVISPGTSESVTLTYAISVTRASAGARPTHTDGKRDRRSSSTKACARAPAIEGSSSLRVADDAATSAILEHRTGCSCRHSVRNLFGTLAPCPGHSSKRRSDRVASPGAGMGSRERSCRRRPESRPKIGCSRERATAAHGPPRASPRSGCSARSRSS